MEQIIKITYDINHEQPVVSSLQVAEDFEKDHGKVIKAIEKHITDLKSTEPKVDWFYETTYVDKKGETRKQYLMNRDGFSLLVMSFNNTRNVLDWKLKYIKAFNRMEQEINAPKKLSSLELLELQYNAIKEVDKKTLQNTEEIKEVKGEVDYLKNDARLDQGQYGHICTLVSGRIREVKTTRKLDLNKKQNGLLFQGLNREIKEITGVRTRSDLRQKHYDLVCDFIHTWEPSSATIQKIRELGDSNV